jgi:protein TonB
MWNDKKPWDSNRPIIFKFSLACSLAFVLMAFNLKSNYEAEPYEVDFETEELTEVIRTAQDEKKAVPPPPIPPETVLDDLTLIDDVEFQELDPVSIETPIDKAVEKVEYSDYIEPSINVVEPEVPDIIVEPKTKTIEKPMIFAERMPVFGECNTLEKEAREKCSVEAMMKYVYKHIKYPAIARENGAEGNVVARFVIDKKGQVTNVEIVRDFGFGSGQALERLLNHMPKWEAAMQNGRRVKVILTLPVKFKLSN